MLTQQADWYDTPLYYDIIFDQDTAKEAAFLEALTVKHSDAVSGQALRILEPACGSGRLITELALHGHQVSGFDLNEHMLEYTRERLKPKHLKAALWQGRMEDFALPSSQSFDLAHCLVSTFKYVLEEGGALSHLQRVASSLRPGGLYVIGVHLTDYANEREQHERWVGERDGVQIICNTHTWPPDRQARREALRTRLRITRDEKTTVQETRWQFRTYNAAEMKRLLKKVPALTCVACYDFTYDIASPRELDDSYEDIVLVLRKEG